MDSVQATFRNGQLELAQPVDWPEGTRVEVVPLLTPPPSNGVEDFTWPPGYFVQTDGALEGEEFERTSQGELPVRENW